MKTVLHQIALLAETCVEVNKDTEHTVFFYLTGHIDKVQVDAHIGGWYPDSRPDISMAVNISTDQPMHDVLSRLESVTKAITELI